MNSKVDSIKDSVASLVNTVASLAKTVHSDRNSVTPPAQSQEPKTTVLLPFEPPVTSAFVHKVQEAESWPAR